MMTRIWVRFSVAAHAIENELTERRALDCGSGSVDTAIVVGLVAAAALALAGLMTGAIRHFGSEIPTG